MGFFKKVKDRWKNYDKRRTESMEKKAEFAARRAVANKSFLQEEKSRAEIRKAKQSNAGGSFLDKLPTFDFEGYMGSGGGGSKQQTQYKRVRVPIKKKKKQKYRYIKRKVSGKQSGGGSFFGDMGF